MSLQPMAYATQISYLFWESGIASELGSHYCKPKAVFANSDEIVKPAAIQGISINFRSPFTKAATLSKLIMIGYIQSGAVMY